MHVFVTGATGFVGLATVCELIAAGHQVTGMARDTAKADGLSKAGAFVHMGDVEDHHSLRAGLAKADAVIHTAFNHDFSKFLQNCENDRQAILAMGEALEGRPMVVTSGLGVLPSGVEINEETPAPRGNDAGPRAASELACEALMEKGANISVMRLPASVHDAGDGGFVPLLIRIARDKGVAAYAGEGTNLWAAVHRRDAARAFRLAVERGEPRRYHLAEDPGIAFRAITETIGKGLGLPVQSLSHEDAAAHFGWFAHFAELDIRATNEQTKALLGWKPDEIGLLADMEAHYFG
ncbi:SDR family oxidoreductase [Breoghania sp. JC706]|uniref:SDR family oxidoreductase n=1 Tax=Breoghania sp. JC706 TaxID=3117732 RepID=UPI003007FE72